MVLAMFLWGFRLVGLDAFVVQSGSMEPKIPVGSMVYVKKNPENLKVGDVITFQLSGDVRGTHRIIEILEENGETAYRTKGDANEEADSVPVSAERIIGRVCLSIPRFGFLVNYIQQPPGMYVAISAVALLLLLIVLPDLIFEDKKVQVQEEKQ